MGNEILCCDECGMPEEGVIFYREHGKILCRDCNKFLIKQNRRESRLHKPINELLEEYGEIKENG